MSLARNLISGEWAFFERFMRAVRHPNGRKCADHHLVLDDIFWIARPGAPWKDLPEVAMVYRQFRRWTLAVRERPAKVLRQRCWPPEENRGHAWAEWRNRKKPINHDKCRYKRRNRLEIMFGRLEDRRRVATRSDRCPIVRLSLQL